MLTAKQFELLRFIDGRLRKTGVSPSFEEMKEALDLKSKSGVHRLVSALEEREFIRRLPNRARALEVLRMPEAEVTKIDFGAKPKTVAPAANDRGLDIVDVPLHGRIAAGQPIEAMETTETLSLPTSLLGKGDHYALEVSGDSMIEAGIFDGDYALIERCDDARTGDIVVALIDNNDATLKTLNKNGDMIRLDPANSEYRPQNYRASQVQIQGKLVGLLRRY
ncbi:transcriptional repressor LexA [Pacificimonas sp. WHA3]|uniref:LexA repressor n=1 Tax=Pacificimonas pallii TaxID=2827236 RepID=A0ABS6SDT6_9SPHN|nr:transcriptional repressor LexA [Pacificimonas pallii]MBV7256521.1 transcriptional repressor LexA [Pacificimonas pallii]